MVEPIVAHIEEMFKHASQAGQEARLQASDLLLLYVNGAWIIYQTSPDGDSSESIPLLTTKDLTEALIFMKSQTYL
jgi:hypothetical protein